MKTKQILNLVGFALAVGGLLLKANHMLGGNICIALAIATLLFSLWNYGLSANREAGLSNKLNYFLVGTITVFLVGLMFKFMHWPGSGILVVVAYVLAFSIPLVMMAVKSDFIISRQFATSFFTYFILLIGLFPNNPISKFLGNGVEYTSSQNAVAETECRPNSDECETRTLQLVAENHN